MVSSIRWKTAGSYGAGGVELRQEPRRVVASGAADARRAGGERLHQHPLRRCARPAGVIREKVLLLDRKSGRRSVPSASSTTPSVTSGKSCPLATIWVPTSTPEDAWSNRRSSSPCLPAPACSRRPAGRPRAGPTARSVLDPLGTRSRPWRSSPTRTWAALGAGPAWPQWWQRSPPSLWRTSDTSQLGHSLVTAGAARQVGGPPPPVDQKVALPPEAAHLRKCSIVRGGAALAPRRACHARPRRAAAGARRSACSRSRGSSCQLSECGVAAPATRTAPASFARFRRHSRGRRYRGSPSACRRSRAPRRSRSGQGHGIGSEEPWSEGRRDPRLPRAKPAPLVVANARWHPRGGSSATVSPALVRVHRGGTRTITPLPRSSASRAGR